MRLRYIIHTYVCVFYITLYVCEYVYMLCNLKPHYVLVEPEILCAYQIIDTNLYYFLRLYSGLREKQLKPQK